MLDVPVVRAGVTTVFLVRHGRTRLDAVGQPVDQHTACWNQLELDGATWRAVAVDRLP